MGDPTCDAQALYRGGAVIVIATLEVWVEADGLNLGLSESDLFGGGLSPAGDDPHAGNAIWVHGGPFQGATTAHRSAQYCVKTFDTKLVGEFGFGIDGVAQRDKWEA